MIIDLGLIDYEDCYKVQKEFARRRKLGALDDSLIVAEHKPVFTIGRTGRMENLLEDEEALSCRGIKVLRVDRGGDITFHGPGQVVIYPIIDLRRRGKDLHKYLRDLEEISIRFLKEYSVAGRRFEGKTGVWAGDKKIASIGVGTSGWVTYHGLSVNINTDLSYFSMIYPCGMKSAMATSLAEILRREIPMPEAKAKLVSCFRGMLGMAQYEYAKVPAALA